MGGAKVIDDYTLGALIGSGLTGSTYVATRTGPDGRARQAAVKLVDPARATLLDSAQRLQEDLDPRLVRYEAVGGRGKGYAGYWATDIVRGESLEQVVQGASFERRLRAALDVAEAVAVLHAERPRIVHGHLLPQNVLLRREKSGALHAVVTDVGVRVRYDAAFHDGPEVAPRLYPWLAPEAVEGLRGNKAGPLGDAPADVYAVGALLCALLTGRGPGTAEGERTAAEILRSKERRTYFVGALLEPGDPVDLECVNDLLQRSLAPRPGDRPSAGELAQGLRAALLLPEPALP